MIISMFIKVVSVLVIKHKLMERPKTWFWESPVSCAATPNSSLKRECPSIRAFPEQIIINTLSLLASATCIHIYVLGIF